MIPQVIERFIDEQEWLDAIGDPLQQYLGDMFKNRKPLKNVLNGTWFGHPVHPAMTDIPVGAWTVTMLLDAVALMSGNGGIAAASDITLATGLAASVGAAATGFTDWSDTYGREKKVGLFHGLTMLATTGLYGLSLLARISGNRGTGVFLSNIGLATLLAGAYVGGDEVFSIGYGVNHTAFEHGPSDWVPVIESSMLEDGKPSKVDAKGVAVMVVHHGDAIHALADTCTHAGCSLSGGTIESDSVICPCHGSQFRLEDGSILNGPATRPEPAYEVRVVDGTVEVRLKH